MSRFRPDIEPATVKLDRGERPTVMEPLAIGEGSRFCSPLSDLALALAAKSEGFRRSLPPGLLRSLATLVRSMNCYYSNLIEGHDTHPVDIERALANDYSGDVRKRELQMEARAHIAVQRWIDEGGLRGRAFSVDGLREVHRRFYELLPEELTFVEAPGSKERVPVAPGEFRQRDVQVGAHLAVSPGAVPRFLERYVQFYGSLGKAATLLAAAAAHHRLLWIHPFLDGNGRVARLCSHATLLEVLDTGAIWSVARGLARNAGRYKSLLARCDMERRNDLDGRGNLSEEALAEFTQFFLETCLDQVAFMEELMQPSRLRTRMVLWAEEEVRMGALPPRAEAILEAVLYRGELARGETGGVIGGSERTARRVVAALMEVGVLTSESSRAPLRLAFPAALAGRWMPGLFPDQV